MSDKQNEYPAFKGMDIQNDKYLISVGSNGIFLAGIKDGGMDVEFSYDELYRLGQAERNGASVEASEEK